MKRVHLKHKRMRRYLLISSRMGCTVPEVGETVLLDEVEWKVAIVEEVEVVRTSVRTDGTLCLWPTGE